MRHLLLTLLFSIIVSAGICQTNEDPYGPVATKELASTIGQTYIILPLDKQELKRGYTFLTNTKLNKTLPAEATGTHITLEKVDDVKEKAFFKDSIGNEYSTHVYHDSGNQILDVMLLSDYIAARKLYLNKTLWLNAKQLATYNFLDLLAQHTEIDNVRFEPVTVIDISFTSMIDRPLLFTVKTSKGQTGYVATSVSGTNTIRLPETLFYTEFFDKDPKTLYHFTPQVWKLVKAGSYDKGMPLQAFILVRGEPSHINHTGSRTQLVYGDTDPNYYYFENDKFVSEN